MKKTGLYRGKQHLFVFERYQGVLQYDERKPEASQIRIAIESASLVNHDTWVSAKDLRQIRDFALNDMLDAAHHRDITFVSNAIRAAGAGQFQVEGTLTIRGIGKPATVLVSLEPRTGGTLVFRGESPVRLSAYGLKPPSAAMGMIGTKDEMTFSFSLCASAP